jgi:hypothetical protein
MLMWLWKGDVKAESESEIIAAQDQALPGIVQQKYHKQTRLYNIISARAVLAQ